MGYGHRYYSEAERLKAVKGYMNAGMPVSKYAEKIGVNARTLRDWIRAFRSFNGGFINVTKAANDPSKLVTNYGMEIEALEDDKEDLIKRIFKLINDMLISGDEYQEEVAQLSFLEPLKAEHEDEYEYSEVMLPETVNIFETLEY